MRDLENIDEDDHDYSPNELAELSIKNPDKHRRIVEQNIPEGMSVEEWEQRNLEHMRRHLNSQS
jgi:hypothetical protein